MYRCPESFLRAAAEIVFSVIGGRVHTAETWAYFGKNLLTMYFNRYKVQGILYLLNVSAEIERTTPTQQKTLLNTFCL